MEFLKNRFLILFSFSSMLMISLWSLLCLQMIQICFFWIKILRNLLIVRKINYRKCSPDLKQINYGLTYLEPNICCSFPERKVWNSPEVPPLKTDGKRQNSSELINTVIKTVMSSFLVLNDQILWSSMGLPFSLRFIFHVQVFFYDIILQ